MALGANQLFSSADGVGSSLRAFPTTVQPKTFASGSGTLARLTMVTFNTSTNLWQVFRGQTNEVNTLSSHAATPATAGTFTLTVNGVVSGAIAFDATPAAVQAALEAMSNIEVGDVTVELLANGPDLGDAATVYRITWAGNLAGQDITISLQAGGLTGNAHVVGTPTAGGADEANGTDDLKGLVWPDPITLDAANEVLGNVMLTGRVHADDIPLVTGAYGEVEKNLALRTQARNLGIIVEGLSQVR